MKVFIYRSGKTFGPYSIDQLNKHLKQGNVLESDLACHDGKEWINLSEVPGIFNQSTKLVCHDKPSQTKINYVEEIEKNPIPKPKRKKIPQKIFLFAGIPTLAILIMGIFSYFFSGNKEDSSINNAKFVKVTGSKLGNLDPLSAAQKIDKFLFTHL